MSKTLQLKFGTTSGEKSWKFPDVKDNLSTATVKSLMSTMITNGSIYAYPPLTMVSAKIVTTTETAIDLSD